MKISSLMKVILLFSELNNKIKITWSKTNVVTFLLLVSIYYVIIIRNIPTYFFHFIYKTVKLT